MKLFIRRMGAYLGEIFSFKDDYSKGRIIGLSSNLLVTFYNVFITGIFYTGFLSMYDMSITDAGILTFVPYIATLFSVFSPKILNKFPRRKPILLTARVVFYFLYVVAATVMPQFVQEPRARLVWFVVIAFVAHAFYALFSGGFTTWFYKFYPDDHDLRMRYIMLLQIFGSVLSSIVLLGSGLLTDALSNSPLQDSLILIFRYFAFGLVLIEVFFMAKAKEFPYEDSADLKLKDVFILPFRQKKFLLCMGFMFAWNYIANLNNGLWNYHMLNHLGFSYTIINFVSVMYTMLLLALSGLWRRLLRRYSWIKTFGIAVLIVVPTEFVFFAMSKETGYLYVPNMFIQHIANVGLNLAYSNVLYMNLPNKNSTAYITFHTIGCNVFAFLGLMSGTLISDITGDTAIQFLGLEVYSVQFTTLARAALLTPLAIFLITKWRSFTSDHEAERVDALHALAVRRRAERKERRTALREYRATQRK